MPTFKRCDPSVAQLAREIMGRYDEYSTLIESHCRIDFGFAFCDRDENDNPKNTALTSHGVKVLGITRMLNLKDQAFGRGHAEIMLDGDWWKEATQEQRLAMLDHELHHIQVTVLELGYTFKLRKHDFEFGWFNVIAERHRMNSIECMQARKIFEVAGQLYWPEIADAVA